MCSHLVLHSQLRGVHIHSHRALPGVIPLLFIATHANGRSVLIIKNLHVVRDLSRIEIIVVSLIDDQLLLLQLVVSSSRVEVVFSSLVRLQRLYDSLEGVASLVGILVIMHLIALRDPHRCQDRDHKLQSL